MPQYVTLFHYTPQGIATIKQGPARLDAARKAVEKVGGKILAWYLTVGQYDAVSISEFPSDEVATKFLIAVVQQGNLTSETLKAFDEAAFRKMMGELP